ncbi:MAG: type II secretion system F family protein [candidate division FCPU426 bacterium]
MSLFPAVKYLAIASVFFAVYLLAAGWRPEWLERLRSRWERGRSAAIPAPAPGRAQVQSIRWWRNPEEWLRRRSQTALAGMIVGYLLANGGWLEVERLLWAVAGMTLGYYLPPLLVALWKQQRLRTLGQQLPDALSLVGNSLRAGLSLVQALEVVAQEAPSPIRLEFLSVVRDCRLGLAPEEALEKMLKRWPHADLELFVVAAGVSLRTGGNLAEVTARLVETVRERFRLKGRIDALTAQGKLSGWVVGILPVGLLLILAVLDPPLITDFLRHPLGWVILAAGAVLELVGAFFIRQIVNIEV